MRNQMIRVLTLLMISMWLCSFATPAVAAPRNNPHLTAQEQGTLELIEPMLRAIEQDLGNMRRWYKIANDRQTGWLARFSSQRGHVFANGIRDGVIILYGKEKNYRGPRLVIPDSMNGLVQSYAQLVLIGRDIELGQAADQAHWSKLFAACDSVLAAERDFYALARNRGVNYSSVDMSYNLSLEVKPIPLKIDFIKNEIKISRSVSFGPISIGASGGISGSRTGVTTIIVIANGTQRVFATGGRVIEFEVPASHVRIDGAVMTISAL